MFVFVRPLNTDAVELRTGCAGAWMQIALLWETNHSCGKRKGAETYNNSSGFICMWNCLFACFIFNATERFQSLPLTPTQHLQNDTKALIIMIFFYIQTRWLKASRAIFEYFGARMFPQNKTDAVHSSDESSEVLEDSCHTYDPTANMDFCFGNSSWGWGIAILTQFLLWSLWPKGTWHYLLYIVLLIR